MIPGVLIIRNELKENSNSKKKYCFASPKKNLSFSTIFRVYIIEKKN